MMMERNCFVQTPRWDQRRSR